MTALMHGTPRWEFYEGVHNLIAPVLVEYTQGMVEVGTDETGIHIHNATVYANEERVAPRFRSTEEAKAFALATYLLE